MKKLLLVLSATIAALLINSSSAVAINTVTTSQINNYEIDYSLSRDIDNRSVLATTETIIATYPDFDESRGIERFIPVRYNGHPVELNIESITDELGVDWNYTTYHSGDYLAVRIGEEDKFMHGEKTYIINYTQHDVTRYYQDTGVDEFYWDTNGTEWKVPIQNFQVSLTINDDLAPSMTGQIDCYQGAFNSNQLCQLSQEGNTLRTAPTSLASGENITVAIGFTQNTFTDYQPTLIEQFLAIWSIIQIVLLPISIIITVFITIKFYSWRYRKKDIGTIIPEYLPPKQSSVSLSNAILPLNASNNQKAFTAQLIDLAVRHYLKLTETKKKTFLIKQTVYEFEIIRPTDELREEEKEFLRDIFKGSLAVGRTTDTHRLKHDQSLWTKLSDNPKKIKNMMLNNYGLKQKDASKSAWFKSIGITLVIIGILLLSPLLIAAAVIAFIQGHFFTSQTDKALELRRYLDGLKLYISVAEKERLKMLQSPDGAQKVKINPNDPGELVKLYEKLLPYAILFGQEKKWNKELGKLYESSQTQPDWLAGSYVFNSIAFSSAMNSLGSTISSSGAFSSSSGGTGGGGFSGGGGGGGGGGFW